MQTTIWIGMSMGLIAMMNASLSTSGRCSMSVFEHLNCGSEHLDSGFEHLDIDFEHLDIGFGHLDIGFGHLDIGFEHLDCGFEILEGSPNRNRDAQN